MAAPVRLTMELFLNLLWGVIALASLAAWRGVWVRQERIARHTALDQWAAFTCALVFLFFAVSLTDDLHQSAALFDECSSGRRGTLAVFNGHAAHKADLPVMPSAAVLPSAISLVLFHQLAIVSIPDSAVDTAAERSARHCRAPPAVL